MVYIYVLKLEENKYYIGKTNNPAFRLDSHFSLNGSQWTKKYRPIKLLKMIPNCDDYDEDKITKQFMDKYGIDNVRGGSFTSITLNNNTKELLNKMNKGTNDKCFKCGKKGHFANSCYTINSKIKTKYEKYDSEDEYEEYDSEDEYEEYDSEDEYEEVWCCNYCGKEFDTKNGCVYHENVYCKNQNLKNKNKCFRCGRKNHYADNCYASKHVDGYYI